jgi:hypothetical protein
VSYELAHDRFDHFYSMLENLTGKGPQVLAGYASLMALRTALNDEPHCPAPPDGTSASVEEDDDLDPLAWDASRYAAMAETRDWNDGFDAMARRKFWYWYLEEAVSAAWNTIEPRVP